MIGQQFTTKRGAGAAAYRIVAVAGDGRWVLQRTDAHEAPMAVTTAELAARFKVKVEDPAPVSEADGWRALSETAAAKASLAGRRAGPTQPSPEQAFEDAANAR